MKSRTKLIITYSPEMNIWTVSNGKQKYIVTAEDFGPGGRLESSATLFLAAKEAVISGKAVSGVHLNTSYEG